MPVQPDPIGKQAGEAHYCPTAKTIQEIGRAGLTFFGNEFEVGLEAALFDNYHYDPMAVLNMLRKATTGLSSRPTYALVTKM